MFRDLKYIKTSTVATLHAESYRETNIRGAREYESRCKGLFYTIKSKRKIRLIKVFYRGMQHFMRGSVTLHAPRY